MGSSPSQLISSSLSLEERHQDCDNNEIIVRIWGKHRLPYAVAMILGNT
jgi:hypothetical protein